MRPVAASAPRAAAGRLWAVAGSRPAALAAAAVLTGAGLAQAWYADMAVVGPLGAAVVLATLPLAWWRTRPAVTGGLMAAGAACYALVDIGQQRVAEAVVRAGAAAQPVPLPAVLVAPVAGGLIGLYLLVRHGRRRGRWLVVLVTAALLGNLFGSRDDVAGAAVFVIVVGIVALDAIRTRSELLRERAATLERSVAAQRREAVVAERARIARELHDLVAHSVSVIAVQAELLPPTIPDLPDEARAGFERIGRSARSAMTELRQLLDVLRDEGTATEFAPLPTLADIDELAAQHRAAGGSVEVHTRGARRPLPAVVELSAYRVVQEALTNTRRHAPGAHAQVELSYTDDLLTVGVTDDGAAATSEHAAAPGAGHGLVGMRERVHLIGGRLRTRHRPEGGFEVIAELPLPPRTDAVPEDPGEAGDIRARAG